MSRDENLTEPKGWIRGNTNIGPLFVITTSHLQCKYGVEIRIESEDNDNYHSWVRISHGLIKLVMDLSNKEDDDNEQEISEMKFEVFASRTNVFAFASRSKAKAKPQRRTSVSSKTVPVGKELGPVLNHKIIRPPTSQCRRNCSIIFVMVIYFEKMMGRLNSGESKTILRDIYFPSSIQD